MAADSEEIPPYSEGDGAGKRQSYDDTPATADVPKGALMATAEGFEGNEAFIEEDLPILHTFPSWIKWIAAGLCFLSGCVSSYSFKIQNKEIVERCADQTNPDCTPQEFVGAFLQALMMFVGEALCLVIWYIDYRMNKPKKQVPWTDFTVSHASFVKKPGPPYVWAIPAAMDTLASVCVNVAMTLTYASTVQMLRNFLVVISALSQLVLIRRALRLHEWIGVTAITGAMVLTAIPAIQNPESSSTNDGSKAWLGILLAVLGTSMQGLQMIFEEFLFKRWRCSVPQAVGYEGISGCIFVAIIMPISQATGLEDVRASFYQFAHSWKIGVVTAFYLIACIIFNMSGLATTKTGGGLLRSIILALRGPAVWIIDLIVGWISFDVYNLVSIFIFLIGFAIHVRMYPPSKFPRLHKFLSRAIPCFCTKRELDEDYVPLQPTKEALSSADGLDYQV